MRNKSRIFLSVAIVLLAFGCQKLDKPELGAYPVDANPPDGPLQFYAAFNGTDSNRFMNGVDSIRALFPTENPLASTTGVNGNGIQGAAKQFIKYPSFNSWAASSSMTISVWIKASGDTTRNNKNISGTEHIMSLRSQENNYHWSNAVMFLFLEGNNSACAIKSMFVSPSSTTNPNSAASDAWFVWENGEAIAGLLDSKWHHLVLTYNEINSSATLFIDGVQNPNVKTWGGHGPLRLSTSKIAEYRLGRGPRNDDEGDGEGGWLQSSFKGGLDQLRLYGKALSATEVQALYNSKL